MTSVTIQNFSQTKSVPSRRQIKTWVDQTLPTNKKNCAVNIRIVGNKEIKELNKKYRKKNKPTNIISFQFEPPPRIKSNFLGDIVICASIVKREAKLHHQSLTAHWAHLVIHGVLHLLGYTHHQKKEAQKMERLEIKYLQQLGFTNPYE